MKNITLIIFLGLSTLLSAQSKAEAQEAIKQLKDGVLIVNLIHPQKKIEALLENGRKEDALVLQSQVEAEHSSLILAFTNNYTFSKVLFVNSFDIGRFTEGDPSALTNVDGIAEQTLPPHYFYIELSETPGKSLTGFVVKKANRDPLSKPFPYFVSQYEFFNLKKLTFVQMVDKLDAQFSTYYYKALRL